MALPGDRAKEPVVILQGRGVSAERFAELLKKFPGAKTETLPDTDIEIAHFAPAAKGGDPGAYAAAVGTSVIVSPSRDRLAEALEKRDGAKKTKFADPTVEAGLKNIYRQPAAVTAVFGLRGPLAELSEAAADLRFCARAIALNQRKARRSAAAGAQQLVGSAWRAGHRGGAEIARVA